jgi:chemotaxis protein methyltransferase CheR
MTPITQDVEEIEIQLLLEGIFLRYGYDFRDYSPASLRRRIRHCLIEEKLNTVSSLQERILHDPAALQRFLWMLSVNVTAMFRDPNFYKIFRQKVLPMLRSYSFIRIWHAGCSTGAEVYSMAILLEEEGLYEKTRLYATDMNEVVLQKAKEGIFPLKEMQTYTRNYQQAGGKHEFSEYYTAQYDHVLIRPTFKKNIVWAQHNLVSDASFNEFHVILCRNVLIYFNKPLQNRVHELLYESLAPSGVLGLGDKESLNFTPHDTDYKALDKREKWYQKVR